MDKVTRLCEIANQIAAKMPDFFVGQGPGKGNKSTNAFMKKLRCRAQCKFGEDFSEKKICDNVGLTVDFYFPDEGAIVEVALSLKNPNTEYEKDIWKAVIAKSAKSNLFPKVNRLIFLCKPGGAEKCEKPGRLVIKQWLKKHCGITIEVFELSKDGTNR